MYNKVNITENTLLALLLFTNGFDKEYYIREVGRLLKISPRTAQLILEDLEDKGIAESKTRGKIKSYGLKPTELSRRYFTLAEQYKSIAFMETNLMAREAIDRMTPFIEGIGIVFGSYAKGTANKDSDLDIFIAGTYEKDKTKAISKTLGLEINVKCYPTEIFEKGIKNDIFLKEVLKNHVIFLNAELFIKKVLKND